MGVLHMHAHSTSVCTNLLRIYCIQAMPAAMGILSGLITQFRKRELYTGEEEGEGEGYGEGGGHWLASGLDTKNWAIFLDQLSAS